ncbi:hypothetical protein GlitD10_0801 [Gloeomargarita lithophora Alchichica-D10]|uniref:Uncharacterized protein n=1 Tax=Gloeomargarita lithophora Alchichica-D10 TaxID=1188229 RepID=A0A1J0AB07_9CYAN|nr:hypothetical protein [Gloeomargarita lithophora]APB33115.1 hypothetical protein GlitD10_0801 [Gloeomargarita lithophora Alchichica-D10]
MAALMVRPQCYRQSPLWVLLLMGIALARPAAAASDYTVVDEFGQSQYRVNPQRIFREQPLPPGQVSFDPEELLIVLINTRRYFREQGERDAVIQRPGVLGGVGVQVEDVTRTLDFMIETLLHDLTQAQPIRLQNPDFVRTHFRVLAWQAHRPQGNDSSQLRLTKYAVFRHPGRRQPQGEFTQALYSINDAWAGSEFYKKYTKQEVLAGAYAPGRPDAEKVTPLAYLTRTGLEEALLQGTIFIQFPDRTTSYFNVDRNNGLAFVRGVSPWEQKRYWYFREVNAIRGYGSEIGNKIAIRPGVTFAGDVWNVGLGRIVLLERAPGQWMLGAIADTGGAFLPNLAQLDYLAGIFDGRREFFAYNRRLPEYTQAYILVKKDE